jgi:two-component system CheB/CheR fusion protein
MVESANLEFATLNSELEQRLKELARANSDIKNLLDNTRIATLFLDRNLRIRAFTPATRELFNFIDADHGRPLADIAPRFEYAALESDVAEVLQTSGAKEAQIELRDRRWFLMRIMTYRSVDEKVEGVVVTFAEITAIKERERQQALIAEIGLRALETNAFGDFVTQSLELIAKALGADLADVCQVDLEARELRVVGAAGFEHDFRTDPPETIADPSAWESEQRTRTVREPLPPRLSKERVKAGVQSTIWLAHREPFGMLGVYTRSARSFSNEDRLFLDAIAHVFTTALQRRAVEQAVSRAREAAALARSQEQLRRAERLASLGTFAAGIAHEVNNPLTNIALAAEYAQRTDDAERRTGLLAGIVKNAQRCGRIVESVLSFARDETTQKWATDINDVLRRAAELVRSSVEPHRLELGFELSEPSPCVECNPTEMEQVIVNLMKNALEASSGKCTIHLRSERSNGRVRVSVADDGPGIAAKDKAHIFDPFFSTRRNAGGTGLGLSITHRIVSSHGGVIAVADNGAHGTRFDIELPEWLPQ